MSEQKPVGVVSSVTGGMMVGDKAKHHHRAHAHLKLWGLIVVVVLVLAGAGWAAYDVRGNSTSPKSATSAVKKTVTAPPADASAEQKSQYYADEGQYQSAEQSLQAQLASTTDTTSKVAIYNQQAAVAVQFKQYSDAKKYADEALQAAPNSPQPYASLAQLATAQNNTALAKKYWQQAIDHVNSNMPGYNIIKQDYQSQLDALK